MAETSSGAAGVSTREIDLSFGTIAGPSGVPAAVLGTSERGPAFVPVTVANFSDFIRIFGPSDGEKFGPLAVSEWLKNAQACTYVRVLGCGDGKQRNTSGNNTGNVTNAGFVVGAKLVQPTGLVGVNPYAVSQGPLGRTHLLGCFMSESNGSTIFSAAGMQGATAHAKAVDAIDTTDVASDTAFSIRIPTSMGGESDTTATEIFLDADQTTNPVEGANKIAIGINSLTDAQIAAIIIDAINGTTHANIDPASSGVGQSGVDGVTAAQGSSDTQITLTMDQPGPSGNVAKAITSTTAGSHAIVDVTGFTGGNGGAVPILRGVLMAASGVVPMLSGNFTNDSAAPSNSAMATAAGPKGATTGSVDLNNAEQNFVVLLNGHKGTAANPNVITASFDMDKPHYIRNVFNTDPDKLEEKGHYLYANWDIHPSLAVVTGSGIINAGKTEARNRGMIDCAILTTGVLGRNVGGAQTPNYENFEDRFRHAETPWFFSQKFGGKRYNLFKVHATSDGASPGIQYKISIENVTPSNSDTDLWGTFDLVVRDFNDVDAEPIVIESFRGLSMNPASPRYISRAIGDRYTYFDFDKKESSQKLVTAGDHISRSRYIRVEISPSAKADQVPDDGLPMGFRGLQHLVTSGSGCVTSPNGGASAMNMSGSADNVKHLAEPPVSFRENVYIGLSPTRRPISSFYWGVQWEQKVSYLEPNSANYPDKSLITRAKYFPRFHTTNMNVSVGNNNGTADKGNVVLDSDRFNQGLFSLEHISVRTGSDGKADSNYWHSASYVRDGNVSISDTNKLRALKISDLTLAGNRRFAKFTTMMQGGFDGVNIFNKDKRKLTTNACRREMVDSTVQGGVKGPTVASYRQAIDVIGNKSDTEIKLLAIPGIRHESVTDYAIDAVENRFDAMYIMDLEDYDVLGNVVTASLQEVSVTYTVSNFKNRALDTSFAAAYFPDVVMQDPISLTNVRVPPSVQVLGAFSLNDTIGHPWFAPAGFARSALVGVIETNVRFNETNLETIYDADINPVTAPIPGRGYVVWGQKTLLRAQSALDRVNVRRLLIEVRRQVKNIANSLLFEPNRASTLARFESLVNPILQAVQDRSGLDRFKVVIDATTTTQADVENNTIRGKVFLQPTKTAEFISLDFVVSNPGDL